MPAAELFVIRTAGGQYVGPAGLVPTPELATHFPSRMAALGKCAEMGPVLDHAAITPYRPQDAPAVSGWENASPNLWKLVDGPPEGKQ
jgi:hypothetical protein